MLTERETEEMMELLRTTNPAAYKALLPYRNDPAALAALLKSGRKVLRRKAADSGGGGASRNGEAEAVIDLCEDRNGGGSSRGGASSGQGGAPPSDDILRRLQLEQRDRMEREHQMQQLRLSQPEQGRRVPMNFASASASLAVPQVPPGLGMQDGVGASALGNWHLQARTDNAWRGLPSAAGGGGSGGWQAAVLAGGATGGGLVGTAGTGFMGTQLPPPPPQKRPADSEWWENSDSNNPAAAAGGGGYNGYGMKRSRTDDQEGGDRPGTVTLFLVSTTHFSARVRKPVPEQIYQFFRLTPGAMYDQKERRWRFPLASHGNLHVALSPYVKVCPVPQNVLNVASIALNTGAAARSARVGAGRTSSSGGASSGGGGGSSSGTDGAVDGTSSGQREAAAAAVSSAGEVDDDQLRAAEDTLGDRLPDGLMEALAPFQKIGVAFVLEREGRAMIADEMGLGKTIQGIACAAAYVQDWPLLVVAPSSARYMWQAELLNFLKRGFLKPSEIVVCINGKQEFAKEVKVAIASYDLVKALRPNLDKLQPGCIVCDECHYLKNHKAARTQALMPLLKQAKRAILLSGTPALSRPVELFTQLHALQSKTWSSLHSFGLRYCAGKKGRFGWDYSGSSNIPELHALLRATVMVRRLKKDILTALPPKTRTLVEVPIEDAEALAKLRSDLDQLAAQDALLGRIAKQQAEKGGGSSATGSGGTSVLSEGLAARRAAVAAAAGGGSSGNGMSSSALASGLEDGSLSRADLAKERKSLLMQLFADTGTCKIPAVLRHVGDIVADEMAGKVLVFAHHRNVLDALEKGVLKREKGEKGAKGTKYIRIDGRTRPKDRQDLVDKFQKDPSVRVALLGLTAAGVGITLTAASRVVFAELFWTPAQLLQAEDRCHRIGQASVVRVQYLVAKDSLDDCLWPLIKNKIRLLGEMVEGEEGAAMATESLTAGEVRKRAKEEREAALASDVSEEAAAAAAAAAGESTRQKLWRALQRSVAANGNMLAREEKKSSGGADDDAMDDDDDMKEPQELDEWGVARDVGSDDDGGGSQQTGSNAVLCIDDSDDDEPGPSPGGGSSSSYGGYGGASSYGGGGGSAFPRPYVAPAAAAAAAPMTWHNGVGGSGCGGKGFGGSSNDFRQQSLAGGSSFNVPGTLAMTVPTPPPAAVPAAPVPAGAVAVAGPGGTASRASPPPLEGGGLAEAQARALAAMDPAMRAHIVEQKRVFEEKRRRNLEALMEEQRREAELERRQAAAAALEARPEEATAAAADLWMAGGGGSSIIELLDSDDEGGGGLSGGEATEGLPSWLDLPEDDDDDIISRALGGASSGDGGGDSGGAAVNAAAAAAGDSGGSGGGGNDASGAAGNAGAAEGMGPSNGLHNILAAAAGQAVAAT